jgi:hypothetical protein
VNSCQTGRKMQMQMVAVIIAAALAVFGQTAATSGAVVPPVQSDPDSVVWQLEELPSPLHIPVTSKSGPGLPNESRRSEVYRQINQLGDAAMPALSRALGDADIGFRRNVSFFLEMVGLKYRTELVHGQPPAASLASRSVYFPAAIRAMFDDDDYVGMDIQRALPALIKALGDSDGYVRDRAVAAIGWLGPNALPAPTSALTDPDPQVRRLAQIAIDRIQGQ